MDYKTEKELQNREGTTKQIRNYTTEKGLQKKKRLQNRERTTKHIRNYKIERGLQNREGTTKQSEITHVLGDY